MSAWETFSKKRKPNPPRPDPRDELVTKKDLLDLRHALLTALEAVESKITMKQAELEARLNALAAQDDKVFTEIRTRLDAQTTALDDLKTQVADLIAASDNADLKDYTVAALSAVEAKTQALDDIIPDAPTPPVSPS